MRKIYTDTEGIYHNCSYQVLWAVKYKRQILHDNIEQKLRDIIKTKCESNEDITLLDIDIYSNYVILLLAVAPKYGIHRAIKYIKSESSHILREEFPELKSKLPTLWDNQYVVISQSTGNITKNDIEEYLSALPSSQRKEDNK